MKQDFRTVITELVVVIGFAGILALGLNGCDNNKTAVVVGEPLQVVETIETLCDEPVAIDIKTFDQDANITFEINGTSESYTNEWGINAQLTVVTPCIPLEPCPDCNVTDCPDVIICGDGTYLNEETNTCTLDDVIDPEEPWDPNSPIQPIEPTETCVVGYLLVDGLCFPRSYIPTKIDGVYNDCIPEYLWVEDREVCRLIRNLTL